MKRPESAAAVNRAFYESLLPGQEDYWRKMAAPRDRISTIVKLLRRDMPGSIVDLGCGNGAAIEEIAAIAPMASLTGVDIAKNQLAINRQRNPQIQWLELDLEDPDPSLENSPGPFDAIVALELIEHLDNPTLFLQRTHAMASQNGKLYMSTQSGPVRETERRVGHRRHFQRQELSSMLYTAGWHPIRVWNTGFPFHDLSKWYANLNPEKSMVQFASRRYGYKQLAICRILRFLFRFNSRTRGAQLFAVAQRSGDYRRD